MSEERVREKGRDEEALLSFPHLLSSFFFPFKSFSRRERERKMEEEEIKFTMKRKKREGKIRKGEKGTTGDLR